MPNQTLTDALKEAYALAPTEVVILDTIQISHPALTEDLFLVRDLVENDFTLEDLSVETFEPVGFRFELPAVGDRGLQELTLAIDNTDLRITDFINTIKNTTVEQVDYIQVEVMTPNEILLALKDKGIQSVLIEGGAATLHSFIDAGLWDEAIIITGQQEFKGGTHAPVLNSNPEKTSPFFGDTINWYRNV